MMEAGRRGAINCGEARGRFQPGSGGAGEISAGVWRRRGDDEADKWGLSGGDRGRRRSHRAAQTRRRGDFWQLRQGRAGRDGPSARVQPAGRGVVPGRVAGLGGRMGRLAVGPFWDESEEKFFSE
jgi:hypothetical protein